VYARLCGKSHGPRPTHSSEHSIISSNVIEISHPLVQHKLTRMRDKTTGTAEFRRLMREVGLLLAYEVTRDLLTTTVSIEPPVGPMVAPILDGKKLCIAPILRAGLGLADGFLDLIPAARVAHIGLYRDPKTLEAVEYYMKTPEQLEARRVIMLDPMLATGNSAAAAVDRIKSAGAKHIRFVALLAAPEGLERFHATHPDVPGHVAAIDEKLNEKGYIIPGLGDAGDQIFGTA
jgi:uracil phosphoribosyltransferase